MKKIFILEVIILLLVGCGTTKKSSSSIAKMMSSTPVKDSYTIVADIYPPFFYVDNKGNMTGQDVEILKKLASNMGVDFSFKAENWADALQKTKNGSYEAIFTCIRNKEREKYFYYPNINISLDEIGILANPSFSREIRSLEDLAGQRIIILEGASYPEEFEKYKKCQKVVAKSYNQLFEWLIRGKEKLAIVGIRPAKYFLEYKALTKFKNFKGVIEKIKVMPIVLQVAPLYIAISKKASKSKDFYRLIENTLLKMQNSGELFKIRTEYNNQ